MSRKYVSMFHDEESITNGRTQTEVQQSEHVLEFQLEIDHASDLRHRVMLLHKKHSFVTLFVSNHESIESRLAWSEHDAWRSANQLSGISDSGIKTGATQLPTGNSTDVNVHDECKHASLPLHLPFAIHNNVAGEVCLRLYLFFQLSATDSIVSKVISPSFAAFILETSLAINLSIMPIM